VFDLGPGPGTSVVECCRVAERLYNVLVEDGPTLGAKTSGPKGMQLYCAIRTRQPNRPAVDKALSGSGALWRQSRSR
jgi:bifunctional non-homologous end joining protein LigD